MQQSASSNVKIQDAKLRAKHTAEAVALYANQSRRVYQLSAEEQMGSDGLDMMITFGIPLHEVLPWKWFWFYKPHQTAFNRARTYFAKDLAHSHAGLLSTGTSEQASPPASVAPQRTPPVISEDTGFFSTMR